MRRRRQEEHNHHDAWAIPYGDLITLLLAFFVVMYSMSSVNEGKYRVLASSMVKAFQGERKAARPVEIGQPGSEGPGGHALGSGLLELRGNIESRLANLVEMGQLKARPTARGLELELSSDVLFASGSARVAAKADAILVDLAEVLAGQPYRIRVEGHTDAVPIATWQFPSNWELSAARAAWVVRRLSENGVAPQRLSTEGFASFRPIADNDTAEGRATNRRVVLVVQKS